MEKLSATIEQLKTRAEEFRARAALCKTPRYAALMRKGAEHLDEHALRLAATPQQLGGEPALAVGVKDFR